MSQAFSLYVARESGLHDLHPLTKLAISGSLMLIGVSLPGIWLTYVAFVVIQLPLAMWGRFLKRFVRSAGAVVLPFAVSLFLIQGLLWPHGTPVFGLGPVSFKAEGLAFAAAGLGRIAMLMGSFLLLSYSTSPDMLMLALTERGLPGSIAYIILTTIQIVPRFQARAQQILDAQRSRGLETEGSLIRRGRALLPLVAPLILGSIVDIDERAIALEARAFSRQGKRTSLLVLHDTAVQAAARWLMLLAAVTTILLRLVPGGWW
jgi:energy-coupling factor transport system permease protein